MNAEERIEKLDLPRAYLGEGYYYRVYELDTNRVFKKLQPYWFSFKKIFDYKRKAGSSLLDALVGAHRARRKEERALLAIKLKLDAIPKQFFANPQFIDHLDYIQDRVTVIERIFEKADFKACKDVIDQYANLQKTFWSYGIHDTTYKLQPNYGMTNDNKLVCLDFGEFVYTKDAALKSIQGSRWLKRGSYTQWLESPVKTYYTETMTKLMNEDHLNRYWNKKVSSSV